MTALSGPILFNNSTGSDSAASGCGPATAISVMLQTSAGSNVANASWSGTISVGDLIYVPANTGRKFNVVAVVGSGSLTFDDNWDDSQMGTAGYVGGKRATLDDADSRRIFGADAKDGFTLELEHTGTAYDLTSQVDVSVSAGVFIQIKGSGSSRPVIRQTVASPHFHGNGASGLVFSFEYLQFTNSSATPSVVFSPQWNRGFGTNSINCVFGDATDQLSSVSSDLTYGTHIFRRCEIKNTTSFGVNCNDGSPYLYGCSIHNCGSHGVRSFWGQPNLFGCLLYSNAGMGLYGQNRGANVVNDCVFYNNTSGGLETDTNYPKSMNNNIFVSNGGYGVVLVNLSQHYEFSDNNAFYNNTSGEVSGGTLHNSITLTADPFVDPTAIPPDFNISDSAGGGATLRANNFSLNTDTAVYPFRQYVSDAFGSGGGGAVLHPLRSN